MANIIAWLLTGVAIIGALYAIALIIFYVALPKDDAEIYYCQCDECNHE